MIFVAYQTECVLRSAACFFTWHQLDEGLLRSRSQKAVTRPGIDEGSLVICVGVWFVTRVGKVGILVDLKIFRAISGVIRVSYILSGQAAEKSNQASKCLFMILLPAVSVFVLETGQ